MTGQPTQDAVVGWVHPDLVHAAFMGSMLRTVAFDHRQGGGRIAGWAGVPCSANVSDGRNQVVHWFLKSPAQWLLMADTDMVWEPDAVHRLLAVADADDTPIVGGLCFALEQRTGAVWPTMFGETEFEGEPRLTRYKLWDRNVLWPVAATGAAFLLVHRRVFETVRERGFSKAFPWFQETENEHGRVSEDITFCMRARESGFPIFVHTGVELGHVKSHVVDVAAFVARREADVGG